ncbi:hypothetical protein KIW84_031165 [Lathyrus oleraceus]|uniref:Uncharacterized protein n=1 Tax=Pisum sativum TaxID=3888 RepID=A0A9D5B0G9_PEA|nr:hypothetical protein KIW84_031165 [Pisum sativum]
MFSVVFHHGGEFVREEIMFYMGGVQSTDHRVIDVSTYVVGNSVEGNLYVEYNVKDIKVKVVKPQCINVTVRNESSDEDADESDDDAMEVRFDDNEEDMATALNDGFEIVEIKTWVKTHTCARVLNIRSAKSKWVAKDMFNKMQTCEKVIIADIMQDMRKNYSVGITPGRAWKAKKIVDEDSTKQYAIIWSFAISPVNGIDMWSKVDAYELHPHLYKKGHVRPTKIRLRELGEGGSRMRRVGVTYRCTKCDKMVHNSRRCKETVQNPETLKRKRKTPKYYAKKAKVTTGAVEVPLAISGTDGTTEDGDDTLTQKNYCLVMF